MSETRMIATAPPASAAEVFKDHGAFVFRLLRRLGVPDADLDDLTQEVFIVVHRSLDRYEERNQIRGWLYRIAATTASRHRRNQKPTSSLELLEEKESDLKGPEETVQDTEARADFDRLLDTLDDERRTVFVLYEVEELSMEDVAAAVGCPVPTAYSRLRAARKTILAAAKRMEAQRRTP